MNYFASEVAHLLRIGTNRQRVLLNNITVRFSNIWRSFKAGNVGQSCEGSGHSGGEDDLPARRRFTYLTRVVLAFSKHPYFPEAEQYSPQNAASVAMVVADGW